MSSPQEEGEVCRQEMVSLAEQSTTDVRAVETHAHKLEGVPDGGWGWAVVAGSTLIHLLLVGTARSFGVLFVLLLSHFNTSAATTAWITSVFNMVRTLNAPVSSMLCERWGSRPTAVCGALLCFAGMSVSAFIRSIYVVYITFGIIGGFGAGMAFTACYIIVGEYFDKNKGKAMGLSTMGCGIGALIFAPLISFLSTSYGYFGTIFLLGAIQLNIAVGAMLYRPLPTTKPSISNLTKEDGDEDTETLPDERVEDGRRCVGACMAPQDDSLLRNGSFLVFCGLMWGMQICIQAFLLFMPAFSMERGATRTEASLLVSFYGGGDILGRLLFGVLFDVARLRPYRVYIYCLVSALYGAVTIAVALTTSYAGCAAVTVLVGLLQAGSHGQRATVVGDLVTREQLAKGVGFLMFSQGLGSITGSPFAGYLRDITGTNASSLYFSGVPIIIFSILLCVQLKLCWKREYSS